jgi:hypothetical protein
MFFSLLIKMFFYHVKQWWDRQGWGVVLFGSLVVLFFLWLFYSRHRTAGTSSASLDGILDTLLRPLHVSPPPTRVLVPPTTTTRPTSPQASSKSGSSKGERKCKEFVEFITGKRFDKIRPDFLTNPVTGHALELDMYNEELRLAIEYNGAQHYRFNAMMHQNNRDRFQNQQYRDLLKKQMCQQHGIRLIEVPYTVSEDKIPEFLYDQLKTLQVI